MGLLAHHFDTAFAAPDGIQKLRELILTLAMQGKLVPQDPNDQPASELLKAIEVEKTRLVKEGKIKQPKPLPEVEPEEMPYDLPDGWKWVRLGSISTKLTDGSHTPPKDSGSGYPMLSSQNVNFGRIDFSNPSRYVSESDFHAENKRTNIVPGDVLLTIVASLGRPAVVPNDAPKFVLQRSVAVISTPISSEFLCRHLGAPLCINYYLEHGKGTAQKGIYLGQLNNMLIALPPLAEQRRIVAKIDQLMARCDELEKLRSDRAQKLITVHTAAIAHLLAAQDSRDFNTAWRFITQHFGELYSVKETVAELRKTILQLAVMGKLVPQDPNDEPASELLKAIELEKQRLVKEGKIKQSRSLPEIAPDEIPYELPKGWEWVQFGNVTNSRLGKMLDKSKNKGKLQPYLRNTNVQWHYFNLTDIKQMKFEDEELDEFRVMPGDLLICEGGEPGRCAIWFNPSQDMYFQKALHRVRPFSGLSGEYLQICLTIDAKTEKLNRYFTGATIKHFPGDKLIKYVIPLPPTLEQHRIVAKIDQLMALCDRLEAAIAAAQAKQTDLLNAVMAQV